MKNTIQNLDASQVAQKAYEYYVQRGCKQGNELDDWLRAEAELSVSKSKTTKMPAAVAKNVPVSAPKTKKNK